MDGRQCIVHCPLSIAMFIARVDVDGEGAAWWKKINSKWKWDHRQSG